MTEVLIPPSPSPANSSTALMTLGLGGKQEEAFGPLVTPRGGRQTRRALVGGNQTNKEAMAPASQVC